MKTIKVISRLSQTLEDRSNLPRDSLAGVGGRFSKVLIKEGRCGKMIQISGGSLVVSRILQVARVNVFILRVCRHIFVSLCFFSVLQRKVRRVAVYHR